ncbi:class I SAM-dependent methyltransferase [Phyllobacterium lublinensis]|uniref:class I SAM-dependent methyltransferase n=1 Tax=Phyllobacterium lublinensis TaxID=2875708 RepID=UPI001CD01FC6|nr:class I SAM-dependent methyltransferase [Phyllobacterium sp. 2063]MBZ9654004.1 class I SAM-dependent methyltransferase [Phyllobacterium sp. 2063]
MRIRAPQAERGLDLYETSPVAVHALLRTERLPQNIWEPACGPGAIARALRAAGHHVLATDIVDYKSPDQDYSGWDFLLEHSLPDGIQAVVTNPPFAIADSFVTHALDLCPLVAMLLRLDFLESVKRSSILEGGFLSRVYVFRDRLPMMHRANWQGPRASNPTAYAWFVWDRAHQGEATLHRISARAPT